MYLVDGLFGVQVSEIKALVFQRRKAVDIWDRSGSSQSWEDGSIQCSGDAVTLLLGECSCLELVVDRPPDRGLEAVPHDVSGDIAFVHAGDPYVRFGADFLDFRLHVPVWCLLQP